MRSFLNILVLVFLFAVLLSKPYSQYSLEWDRFYNGTGNNFDVGYSITTDRLGNVYVTGGSFSGSTYLTEDYVTVKYNPAGVQQWVQRYNGPGNGYDFPYAIVADDSNNVYITGRSTPVGTDLEMCTIKYNTNGVQQWVARYSAGVFNNAYAIAVDNLHNVYITGSSYGPDIYDLVTIKYNINGALQWADRYDGPANNDDHGRSIAVNNLGEVFVTGTSYGNGTNGVDIITLKYYSTGVRLWLSRYNSTHFDIARNLVLDNLNNVYVSGYVDQSSNFVYNFVTLKYNSNGTQQWAVQYNGPGDSSDFANSIKLDGSGNVYVAGGSVGIGTKLDYCLVKYNNSGAQQWVARYNGPANDSDVAIDMALDTLGNVYLTGLSKSAGLDMDIYTAKYNPQGSQLWSHRYNSPNNSRDLGEGIALFGASNIYVTGSSRTGNSTAGDDLCVIKYSAIVPIVPVTNQIPLQFSLSQNYPNPFNPTTNFEFSIPLSRGVSALGGRGVSLIIYDAMGREVETLVNQNLSPGTYKADWDAANFVSGVYFYKLNAGDFSETKKMVLIK